MSCFCRAAVPALIALHGSLFGMQAAPDGSVRAAVADTTTGATSITRIDPAGNPLPSLLLTAPPADPHTAAAGLTPDGAVSLVWPGEQRPGKATLTTIGASGVASTTRLELKATTPPADLVVGPTGAVAVVATDTTTYGRDPRLLFRPSGEAAFGPVLKIGKKLSPKGAASKRPASYDVALGPDGGGVLLTSPAGYPVPQPFLRRITPTGALGPRIPIGLGKHDFYTSYVTVGPLGTIVAWFEAVDTDRHKHRDVRSVSVASVAAGATTAVVQPLGAHRTLASDVADAVAIGADDRVAAVTYTDEKTLEVFAGAPGTLARTAVLKIGQVAQAFPMIGLDGSVSAVWDAQDGRSPKAFVFSTAHQPVGGSFGAPHVIDTQTPADSEDTPIGAIPLPDGGAELAFRRYGPDDGEGSPGTDWLERFTP